MKRLLLLLVLLLFACSETSIPFPPSGTPTDVPDSPTPIPATSTPTQIPPTETPSSAGTFPDPNAYTWQLLVSGLQRPVDLQVDGSGRLFVIEKVGRIRIIENGQLLQA
ncbi:MAG TPA: hypothetical protein VI753_06100, partial [Anaerolineales bacterium]|nr:hypothetical protein [Anaerolineales bacterium]